MIKTNTGRNILITWAILAVGFLLACGAFIHWDGHPSRILMTIIALVIGCGGAGFFAWLFTQDPD